MFFKYRDLNYLTLWLYFACFAVGNPTDAAFFDWIWRSDQGLAERKPVNSPLISIPFESQTDDEKFLEEASKFTELMKSSALDQCQHKVVLKIKTSCSAMTEEELAKMSVNLLNCQSAVDGRQTFPCTDSMTLKECTVKMDANMWNAYHMMNNRARAVCLAARKVQFQALSEMTVNKLMSTAHEQINRMTTLLEGQERLETLTSDTLTSVEKGHVSLMLQQERLRTTQQGIQDFVSHNLKELTREKALIAAGHKELSAMTQGIKEKLDEASLQLTSQSVESIQNHKELLHDFETVKKQANEIFEKIDLSTEKLLSRHQAAAAQYEETIGNLKKINVTVNYLMRLLNLTRNEIDERFYWIQQFLGGTSDQIDKIFSIVSHMAYLLMGMLFISFLNLSTFARASLSLLVPLNLFIVYTQGRDMAFNLIHMTILLSITILVNSVIQALLRYVRPPKPTVYFLKDSVTRTMTLNDELKNQVNESGDYVSPQISKKAESQFYSHLNIMKSFCKAVAKNTTEFISSIINGTASKSYKFIHSQSQGNDETLVSSTEDRNLGEEDWRYSTPLRQRSSQIQSHNLVSDWLHSKVEYVSPPLSTSSRRSASPKIYCAANCRTGRRCRNSTVPGRDYCHRHLTGTSVAS